MLRFLYLKVYVAWFFHEHLYSCTTLLLLHGDVKAARGIDLKCGFVKRHIWIPGNLHPLQPSDRVVQWNLQSDQLNAVRSIAGLKESSRDWGG